LLLLKNDIEWKDGTDVYLIKIKVEFIPRLPTN